MQQSNSDARMRGFDWCISDFVEDVQQNICDAIMDEMGKD